MTPRTEMVIPRAGTLLLTREDVAALLTVEEAIGAVEECFALYGDGKAEPPGILGLPAGDGGFHVKAGILSLGRRYFAAKVNANFPRNRERYELPTIQGVIVLSDADCGYPLAIMDSIEITLKRTAAATAVAAKRLARADARVAMLCGCGGQGRIQLEALAAVRSLERVYLHDIDGQRAQDLARELSRDHAFETVAVRELAQGLRQSDILVTCTTSTRYFVDNDDVPPGLFIAAVGADSPEKQEIDPRIMASSVVVVDALDQCAAIGELHHALERGVMSKSDVHAELAEVVTGKRPGRQAPRDVTVFDSTGMALQDVAAAAAVFEKAQRSGRGLLLRLIECDA